MFQRLLAEIREITVRGGENDREEHVMSSRRLIDLNNKIEPSFRRNSYQLHASISEVIREVEVSPPGTDFTEKIHIAVLKDFPMVLRSPTAENMEDSVLRSPQNTKLKFEPGQWCEYLGLDMKWHLAQVIRLVRVAKRDWKPRVDRKPDWELFYFFPGADLVPKQKVRAPEEALKREFGMRPWVWQQWAFIRIESMMRFQRFHERDFETWTCGLAAKSLFKIWLEDERNVDFKAYYDSRLEGTKDKLVTHLLSPFVLMDEISKDPKDKWDFAKSSDISLYQYVSLLGAGWLSVVVSMVIQCTIPVLLLYEAAAASYRFDFENATENSWERFCQPNTDVDDFDPGLIINIVVLLLYVMRNLPQVFRAYFDTMGEADTVNSRVESLRTLVYYRGEATLGMRVGYRIERFMNSTYIAIVNNTMLFTLFLTDETSEIIFNALAIEFVVNFDEAVMAVGWVDPLFRYIRAATTEMVLRYYVEIDKLGNAKEFCREYDVPEEVFQAGMEANEDGFPVQCALNCRKIAQRDSLEAKYMLLPKDKVYLLATRVAKKNKQVEAQRQYEERPAHFDYVSRLFMMRGGGASSGIFNRWRDYRAWSRWDRVLFASPCGADYVPPNLPSTVNERNENANKLTLGRLNEAVQTEDLRYLNEDLDPDAAYTSAVQIDQAHVRFVLQAIKTLMFVDLFVALRTSRRRRSVIRFVGTLMDCMMEWFAMVYLVFFPFTFVLFFLLQVGCSG